MKPSSTNSRFDSLVEAYHSEVEGLKVRSGKLSMLESSVAKSNLRITRLNERIDNLKLIETYLANFADERQAQVYQRLEVTVSEGLRAVFNEDIKLVVSNKMVGTQRAETVFSLVSFSDGSPLTTGIIDSRGGGVAAIVGFLIQAVLVLLTPGMRPLIFLDETFRNVSEDYQGPLGEFIADLCKRTGLQVILVTHQPTIAEHADVHYEFSQANGKTQVRKVL